MPVAGDSAVSHQMQGVYQDLKTIYLFRGLAIILMVLDPARKYFHHFATNRDPLDLESVKVMFFFTRWITHFAAPVFIFMIGISIFLLSKHTSRKQFPSLLVKTGLLLILSDAVIMSFIITFDPSYSLVLFGFLWTVGICLLVIALLSYLPFLLFTIIALLVFFGHNIIDQYEYSHLGELSILHNILHRPAYYPVTDHTMIGIVYPVLPWIALMMTGYCFGIFFTGGTNIQTRNRILLYTGIFLLLLFIVLRYFNVYGDPLCWSPKSRTAYTLLSFINTTKHPPSLLFLCMTMGPALILLSYAHRFPAWLVNFLSVYGKVPLFFYFSAYLSIHIMAAILAMMRGHSFTDGLKGEPGVDFRFVYPGEGVKIGIVYVLWIFIVLALFPLCKWFWKKKSGVKRDWIKYF